MQTEHDMDARKFAEAKIELRKRLNKLRTEIDHLLAKEYGVDPEKPKLLEKWRASHLPFHWFAEFYGIMSEGGFDVVIGNPPYVEYSKVVKQYTLLSIFADYCTNLYSTCSYRGHNLKKPAGYMSFIVPVSLPSTDRMQPLRELITKGHTVHHVGFSTRPGKLFEGAEQRLTIYIESPAKRSTVFSGGYLKWSQKERSHLFALIHYVDAIPLEKRKSLWPKVKGVVEKGVFQKLLGNRRVVDAGVFGSGAKLYYKNRVFRFSCG